MSTWWKHRVDAFWNCYVEMSDARASLNLVGMFLFASLGLFYAYACTQHADYWRAWAGQ